MSFFLRPTPEQGLNVRSGPSTAGAVVASALPTDLLVAGQDADRAQVGQQDVWLPVWALDAKSGAYVQGHTAAWLVELAADVLPLTATTEVDTGLRVRSGPTTNDEQIGLIPAGTPYLVLGDPQRARTKLGQNGEWLQVVLPDGSVGWAAAWYLVEASSAALVTAPPVEVVQVADPKGDPKPRHYAAFEHGHALVGLHGPADPGAWPWDDDETLNILKQGRIQAVKVLAWGDIGKRAVKRIRAAGVDFIMARLFAKFNEPRTPADFLSEVADATKRLYQAGVRYFEIHNEPNLHHAGGPEGMWVNWQNGHEFGQFFVRCMEILHDRMPEAKFGWPGISPGPDENHPQTGERLRYNSARFLNEAEDAIRQADFVCMHTYWGADNSTYADSIEKVRAYCERFPEQVIMVSEFSNTAPWVSTEDKAKQYIDFYKAARDLPTNCGALFAYLMQASSGFEHEAWRGTPIARLVGRRKG